jgi:predicted nuclease of restriction endonuclease-like (RecB) superfamily
MKSKISKHEKLETASKEPALFLDIKELIEKARENVVTAVNSQMVLLYWNIGNRIQKETLKDKRADYGKQVIENLSAALASEFGAGFSKQNLFAFVRFSQVFPKYQIVSTLSGQFSFSHFRELIYIEDDLKREFYIEMCRIERWSVRGLREKVQTLLYERTAISKKPDELIKQEIRSLKEEDKISPDLVFRDPYFLDFLGLKDTYSEKDLESAILNELQKFISELGTDFAFLARQKRITIDNEDYHIDLLFYHRRMHRLVAIDLKLGKFKAADKGQMELYLRWLEKNELREGEGLPIGLILCAEKSYEHVELLQLDKHNIKVAEYFTELPSKKVLINKLNDAIKTARRLVSQRAN